MGSVNPMDSGTWLVAAGLHGCGDTGFFGQLPSGIYCQLCGRGEVVAEMTSQPLYQLGDGS